MLLSTVCTELLSRWADELLHTVLAAWLLLLHSTEYCMLLYTVLLYTDMLTTAMLMYISSVSMLSSLHFMLESICSVSSVQYTVVQCIVVVYSCCTGVATPISAAYAVYAVMQYVHSCTHQLSSAQLTAHSSQHDCTYCTTVYTSDMESHGQGWSHTIHPQ